MIEKIIMVLPVSIIVGTTITLGIQVESAIDSFVERTAAAENIVYDRMNALDGTNFKTDTSVYYQIKSQEVKNVR